MKALAVLALVLTAHVAVAEAPPAHLVKPVAVCDEKVCQISIEDWRMFQQFHQEKFQAMEMANALLQQAQEEIEILRRLLLRTAGGCNQRKT